MFSLFKKRTRTTGLPTGGIEVWPTGRAAFERGMPAPLGPAELRQHFTHTIPGGAIPTLRFIPHPDRGAANYAFQFGRVDTNPIGNNVVPVGPPITQPFSMATKQVSNGVEAIFWGPPPAVNDGLQPHLGQLYSPQELTAILSKGLRGGK